MTESYPLHWPSGQPRTDRWKRARSNFNVSQMNAQEGIFAEIKRLGGRNPIMSTNIRLRNDGLPYAQQSRIDDPGVAVYFTLKGRPMVFACDKWDQIKDNMRAIQKTIEALRGIERWGSGEMMQQAFTGFMALPPAEKEWWTILAVDRSMPLDIVEMSYKRLAMKAHPDNGGSHEEMSKLNAAIEKARREKNG